MQIQNSSSQPLYSIPTFVFILIFIIFASSSTSQGEDALFLNRSSRFSCGQHFTNITYPFWGGNKSPECGLKGFNLTCNGDDYLTIDIAGRDFRVISINSTSYALTISPDELFHNVCPEDYSDAPLYISPFVRPGQKNTNFSLTDCRPPYETTGPGNTYSCTDSSDNSRHEFFFTGDAGCDSRNISVLVLESAYEEYKKSQSMTLQELLYRGFEVDYNLEVGVCGACEVSGGLCWSGTNSSTKSSCLCSDGPQQRICSVYTQGLFTSLSHDGSSQVENPTRQTRSTECSTRQSCGRGWKELDKPGRWNVRPDKAVVEV